MSPSANVHSIQVLQDLKASLEFFRSEVDAALAQANRDIQKTQAWLAERQQHWRGQVMKWRQIVSQCQEALAACQSHSSDGERPNCSGEVAALARAQAALRQVEAELQKVTHWNTLIQQAADHYQRQARQCMTLLSSDVPKATSLLTRSISSLQAYIVTALPGSVSSGSSSISTVTTGAHNGPSDSSAQLGTASDYSFKNIRSDDLTLRVHVNNDTVMLRVYRRTNVPPSVGFGDVGRANLKVERDFAGNVVRVRLQDIETLAPYKQTGVGSVMLDQIEALSHDLGAAEIYGEAPSDQSTRDWYAHRGYYFRIGLSGGQEVHKPL